MDHWSHDAPICLFVLLWVVSYVGIRRATYQTIGDTLPTRWGSASWPASELSARRLPCQIGRSYASADSSHLGEMMKCGGGGDGRGRGGVGGHLYNSRPKKLIDHDGRRHRMAAMGPHSRQKNIQQSTNILFERATSLKLEKIIVITIFMTIFSTTHWRISCPMFVDSDGHTADAEHQRQQWRHIYVVYGPPCGRYARFAMPAMLGASATEVRWLLISSSKFWVLWTVTFISLAIPHLLIPGFLRLTWVGNGLGHIFSLRGNV